MTAFYPQILRWIETNIKYFLYSDRHLRYSPIFAIFPPQAIYPEQIYGNDLVFWRAIVKSSGDSAIWFTLHKPTVWYDLQSYLISTHKLNSEKLIQSCGSIQQSYILSLRNFLEMQNFFFKFLILDTNRIE